jgi:hypothetical protein
MAFMTFDYKRSDACQRILNLRENDIQSCSVCLCLSGNTESKVQDEVRQSARCEVIEQRPSLWGGRGEVKSLEIWENIVSAGDKLGYQSWAKAMQSIGRMVKVS